MISYSIYVTNAPPLVKNTNTETKTGFVLFFSNEYFGIKVDLDGKNKKQPGVYTPGCFYAEKSALY